ncbi:MAG: ribose-5-phosphate isomerase RpiA [Pseudomonadota bacterium]
MSEATQRERERAAEEAASLVEAGMWVGLGTGRTADLFIAALGRRVESGLAIKGAVATSERSARAGRAAGLQIADMLTEHAPRSVDLAVDGADELDDRLRLIKGGGASLLREKIVARMAKRFVVIADRAKHVETLGAFPLPIEVVPFGYRATMEAVEAATGVAPSLRSAETGPLVTDNGNFIVDCAFGAIADPEALAHRLSSVVGVVEHGLFLKEADEAVIGTGDAVTRLSR